MTSTVKDTRKHIYQTVITYKVWQRGSGWSYGDVLNDDAGTINTTDPLPEDYLDDIDNFDCIIDDLPETSRQHDGDDEETLWTVSAYELVEDEWGDLCKADDEPAVEAKRWECDLWEHFYPDGKEG